MLQNVRYSLTEGMVKEYYSRQRDVPLGDLSLYSHFHATATLSGHGNKHVVIIGNILGGRGLMQSHMRQDSQCESCKREMQLAEGKAADQSV